MYGFEEEIVSKRRDELYEEARTEHLARIAHRREPSRIAKALATIFRSNTPQRKRS